MTHESKTANRIAVVTGATRLGGIGAAICRAFAEGGIDVFFTHWNPYDAVMPWGADEDGPEALQREIAAMGTMALSSSMPVEATMFAVVPS